MYTYSRNLVFKSIIICFVMLSCRIQKTVCQHRKHRPHTEVRIQRLQIYWALAIIWGLFCIIKLGKETDWVKFIMRKVRKETQDFCITGNTPSIQAVSSAGRVLEWLSRSLGFKCWYSQIFLCSLHTYSKQILPNAYLELILMICVDMGLPLLLFVVL